MYRQKREFDAFPAKERGVTRKPVYRGAPMAPKFTGDLPKPSLASFIGEETEEQPPKLPYSRQVCSTNTFTCSDYSISPLALQQKMKEIIRNSPADVTPTSEWDFRAVFYPQELKTAFKVSFFSDDSSQKNSYVVEMHLQEGDRAAFQNLVTYVKSQASLKYAFADQLGFGVEDDDEDEFENWDAGYKHTSFGPLPLPSSVLLKMQSEKSDDDSNCLVELFLENACSPFADVRRNGWQELANSSNDTGFTKALVPAIMNGQDCVGLAIAELKTEVNCAIIADTQRCVIKTLLNIAKAGHVEACKRMCVLRPQILKLAQNKKSNSPEMQATAVQLMQHLVEHGESVKEDFVAALTVRAEGTSHCRVSGLAQQALQSLKLVEA